MHHHLKVSGMSCGHCVSTIEKAVKGLDPAAEVSADLATGKVTVTSTLEAAPISQAIQDAGYESQVLSA